MFKYYKTINLILISIICFTIVGTYSGNSYFAETKNIEDLEEQILQNKITEEQPADEKTQGYILSVKDREKEEVSNNPESNDYTSTPSEKYYVIENPEDALNFVSASSIEYIEPNYRVYTLEDPDYPPDDPDYDQYQKDYYETIGIDQLWKKGLTGSDVSVGVFDTGYNEHVDMSTPYRKLGLADSSITNEITTSVGDHSGHGTGVASLIHARHNNGKNISGIAEKSNLLVFDIFDDEGYASTSDLVYGLEYAYENGIVLDVVNLSIGHDEYSITEQTVINDFVDEGCIFIASAGNYGDASGDEHNIEKYPAKYNNVIAVGSIDRNNEKTGFSSTNSTVDVMAPGQSVRILRHDGSTSRNNSGTSFSSPIVAGIAALAKEAYPEMDTDSFMELIQTTSTRDTDKFESGQIRNDEYGHGIISGPGILNGLDEVHDPEIYDITYVMDGGSWDGERPIKTYTATNTAITLPSNISKIGHEFLGWSTVENDPDSIVDSIEPGSTESKKYYAIWDSIEYIIDYDLKGGSWIGELPFDSYNTTNVSITLPKNIKRPGYSFRGWSTTDNDKRFIVDKINSMTAGAQKFYAIWDLNKYTVKFDVNGGKRLTYPNIIMSYNKPLGNLPTTTKKGNNFSGWYISKTGGSRVTPSTTVTKSLHLFARWSPQKYTMKFNVNKGKKISMKSKTIYYDKAIGKLSTPKRKGYNFLGWKTKKKSGTTYMSNSVYKGTRGITLYANWTSKKVVRFNANGGNVGIYAKPVKKGKKYGKLPIAKKSGYKFKGWYTKKKGGKRITSKSKVKTKKNIRVYAQWKKR